MLLRDFALFLDDFISSEVSRGDFDFAARRPDAQS